VKGDSHFGQFYLRAH